MLLRLRRETRRLHDAIEVAVPIGLARGGAPEYIAYLRRLWGFHVQIERTLAAVPGIADLGLNLSERRKTPLIAHDLVFLGVSPAEVVALPVCKDVPTATSIPFALGIIYVLEGAMLGGRTLYRAWGRRYAEEQESVGVSNVPPPTALAYLAGYGEQTRKWWSEVTTAVAVFDGNEQATEQIVEAATKTFATLGVWLGVGAGS